jgi:hypothetical protein
MENAKLPLRRLQLERNVVSIQSAFAVGKKDAKRVLNDQFMKGFGAGLIEVGRYVHINSINRPRVAFISIVLLNWPMI